MEDDKLVIDCTVPGGSAEAMPLTPDEQDERAAQAAAHGKQQASGAFATAEDAERLRLVAERARTDPAYAALVDLTLGRDTG